MARRRRVEGPSAEELRKLEAGFAAKPAGSPFAVPPIAQVAGEAAAAADPAPVAARAEAARDHADAERLRVAEAEGRLAASIPIADIEIEELTRDRMTLDRDAFNELKASIRANGLRLPVEVFELATPGATARYGLISGYRRLLALRELEGQGARIPAFIRKPRDAADAFVAMVEENEVRSELSNYERGRIASLTVRQGTFADLDEAVARLHATASKAKRSKIRSFALVHEELGDLLNFPWALTERNGLRLAIAVRMGLGRELRAALANGQGINAEAEWQAMLPVIEQAEQGPRLNGRGGRPRREAFRPPPELSYRLRGGITMECCHDGQNLMIRFQGRRADPDFLLRIMEEISRTHGEES
jgi:ParB family transcriptional regulator, chromosome partitioning protein